MSVHSARTDSQPTGLDVKSEVQAQPPAKARRAKAPTDSTGTTAPVWFEYLVALGVTGVLSFGGFGLLLAVLGDFSAGPVLVLGAAGTVVGTVLARPVRQLGGRGAAARTTAPAAGMCVVAIGAAVWNSIYIAHNVAVASDPGVYAVAGRWLASHNSLIVPAAAPWSGKGTFSWGSPGMYGQPDGTLQFQFAHLLPALLAVGHWLGGDGLMFRVPALLNAIGLCAVYATGCRLIRRPWLVLAAVTALAVSLPQLYFSRDTFSEPATQVLLWGGIWLMLRAYESRRLPVAFVAGLAIGGTLMTRIDAVAYLIPIPLLAAVGWVVTARSREERRSLSALYAAFVVGAVPTAVLGTVDVQRRADLYYSALRHSVMGLYGLLLLSMVVAVVVVILWRQSPRLAGWLRARRKRISIGAVWLIAAVLLLAWSVRPAGPTRAVDGAVGHAIGGVQKSENLPVHPETYAEHTMQWISWYLGPIALILAIVGLCLLTVLALRRGSAVAVVVLAMAAPLTILYLWNPNITSIQIWAMRRYVPASLPLLVLAAAVAVEITAAASARLFRGTAWPRRILVAGAACLIAFPLGATLPVGKFQVQANFLPVVDDTCQVVGPDAAVLFPANDYDGAVLSQTLRSWCGVPAAALVGPTTQQQLQTVAASFRSEGKTLWMLGTQADVHQTDPALTPTLIATGTSPRELEQTVDRLPQHYASSVLSVYGAKVP